MAISSRRGGWEGRCPIFSALYPEDGFCQEKEGYHSGYLPLILWTQAALQNFFGLLVHL